MGSALPPSVTPCSSDRARGCRPWIGGLDVDVDAGLPWGGGAGGVGEEVVGTGCREGTPIAKDCSACSGAPRGGSHCKFRFGSRLWGLPQSSRTLLFSLLPVFFRVNIAPPTPHPTEAPTLPLRGPRAGASDAGESGRPAAFRAGGTPNANLRRAGGRLPAEKEV